MSTHRGKRAWGWLAVAALWLVAGTLAWSLYHQGRRAVTPPWRPTASMPVAAQTPVRRLIPATELAAKDGRDGRECYAAIEGRVYLIPPSTQWQNGEHVPSNGLAYCGRDLTVELGRSPHGDSVLSSLSQVGTLGP